MTSSQIIIGTFLALGMKTVLFAALPPLYETLNEFKGLLASPELTEKLNSADAIEDIQRDNTGFLIKTDKRTLKVDVVYETQKHPGPSKFHFVFHEPEQTNDEK